MPANLREFIMAMRGPISEVPVPPGVERIGVRGPSLGAGIEGEVHWFTNPGLLDCFIDRQRWPDRSAEKLR